MKKIKSALISVYYKDNLEAIISVLKVLGITIYSTGGTQKFIEKCGAQVIQVEELTTYPSILGGRVKTLHPKVFGGILGRRDLESDLAQLAEYEIPEIDLVIVDLYPFEETVASGAGEEDIIEKIDIGGISLIRAAAKNYKDVLVVSSRNQYSELLSLLEQQKGVTNLSDRKKFATNAFQISSDYDTKIFNYFQRDAFLAMKVSEPHIIPLRYGENPHQKGYFCGDLEEIFDKLHGKELSYNNLLDIDAAVNLIAEFSDEPPTIAILKHNNACGLATRATLSQAYDDALAGDPISAFGSILIANCEIDETTAESIHKLFCEVVIAPSYNKKALFILSQKKNRILLVQKKSLTVGMQFRTAINGFLAEEKDTITDKAENFEVVTKIAPKENEIMDFVFANKLVKHTKSNTIVLAANKQLIASGTGQTSRVDALRQAIFKAKSFGFSLKGAVMSSDAFFPFPDCVEIANNEGIKAVIQPGGSIKDKESIDFCDNHDVAMVFTGNRHFKH